MKNFDFAIFLFRYIVTLPIRLAGAVIIVFGVLVCVVPWFTIKWAFTLFFAVIFWLFTGDMLLDCWVNDVKEDFGKFIEECPSPLGCFKVSEWGDE